MPYVSSDGRIGRQKEWSLATIPDFIWGFINFIVLLFQTLINPNLTRRGDGSASTSSYGPSGRSPPPGPPRRMGRINRFGGASPPPMAGGG